MAKTKLLICDLDNTLFDWIEYYVPAYYAMIDKVLAVHPTLNRNVLLKEIREIHKELHTIEDRWAFMAAQSIQDVYRLNYTVDNIPDVVRDHTDEALEIFEMVEFHKLVLYPHVKGTLQQLTDHGIKIVIYSDAPMDCVYDRLAALGLGRHLVQVVALGRTNTVNIYEGGTQTTLTRDLRKPNVNVINYICHFNKVDKSEVAYIGDSMTRDILPAVKSGLKTFHAAYGAVVDSETLAKLKKISHWDDEDVQREQEALKEIEFTSGFHSKYTSLDRFDDILNYIGAVEDEPKAIQV